MSEVTQIKRAFVLEDIEDVGNISIEDKIKINHDILMKVQLILPKVLELLIPILNENPGQRAVIAVGGGSGVGKTEITSLLSYYLNSLHIRSFTLSGDNYPHRVPKYNDAERLRIFRQCGINGLISHGKYVEGRYETLRELQENGNDSNPDYIKDYPWLSVYQDAGRSGLQNYLGTMDEIDFNEVSGVISQFKNGADKIFVKRMGREETDLWYEAVDLSQINVIILEWTHANSHNIQGVDIPILLASTPQETLEYRRARNRDGGVDSPFTTTVLGIEQKMIIAQASKAKLIVSKSGEILSYNDYIKIMSHD